MDKKSHIILKNSAIWAFSVIFTLAIALYQRMTGPTYPVRGEVTIGAQSFRYKLIRTYDKPDGAQVKIIAKDTSLRGEITFRRFKSYDKWVTAPMMRRGDTLVGTLPHQEPAGKVMYQVTLMKGDQRYLLNEEIAVLRYKGHVPLLVLIPHIIFIFLAMLFSTLTGLMAVFKGKHVYSYAWITIITLALGGMIFGPIVQKYSFDAFWTGWPFGNDLTDNKSLIAFLFWIGALLVLRKKRGNRLWPTLAAIVLLIVFLIPHSVLGSEIDYTKTPPAEQVKH